MRKLIQRALPLVLLSLMMTGCGVVEMGPVCEPAAEGGYYLTDHDFDGRPEPLGYYDTLDDCQEAQVDGPAYDSFNQPYARLPQSS